MKSIYAITREGRLAQIYNTSDSTHWRLDFPAERVPGHSEFQSLRFQNGVAVFPTNATANKKALYVVTTDGQLAQVWDTTAWNLVFPAHLAGQPSLRFESGVAVFPIDAAANKKAIFAVTTYGQLAQVSETDRWNLEFIPIDMSAGNFILPSRTVGSFAKQGKVLAGVILGTGINIVTGEVFTTPFAGPLKLVKTGFKTTKPRTRCEIVSSSKTYRDSLEFAASAGVQGQPISVKADVSWVSTQEMSATSLAVVAQAYKDGEEFQPDLTQAVAIDLSRFTNYSDFVAHYGTHFIGGYMTGASYTAIYKMECATYYEAYALSAALNAQGSWVFDANLTAKISNTVSSFHTEATTSWDHAAEQWPDSAPPLKSATPDGISDNLETLNALKSDQLTGPLYYVLYPWKQLNAIANCVWGQNPDMKLEALPRNLALVSAAINDLKYAWNSAKRAIEKQLYQDTNGLTKLNETLSSAAKDLADLQNLTAKAVCDLDSTPEAISLFMQRYCTAGSRYMADVEYIIQPSRLTLKNQDGNCSSALTSNVWVIGERKDLHVEYKVPTGYRKVDFKTTKSNQWGNSDGGAAWDKPDDPTDGRITLHAWADAGSKVTITVSDVMAAKNPRTV
jgi:hypothetical protein